MKYTREEIIDRLIDNDVTDIAAQELTNDDMSAFLTYILRDGWVGYSEMSDKELEKEYNDKFSDRDNEDVEIVKQ